MTEPRPWWASEGPVDGGVDPCQDPIEAHRAARRGRDDDPGHRYEGGADQPGEAPSDPSRNATDICGVCPLCIAARMLGETRPELAAQLADMGRHLAAAMRTLVDAATTDRSGPGGDQR